ncbi:MAG: ankyrin repeat domain-containing protein [Planctomycetota bacterium]|nr:ankyrin repeat domain-containing protein [Planctomycetota bacterium]
MPSKKETMAVLKEFLEAGKLTPVIDRTYPLASASPSGTMANRATVGSFFRENPMSLQDDLLGAFETHAPTEIEQCIANGIDVNEPIGGQAPIELLIGMYLRSDRFSECLDVLLTASARYDDPPLLAVLRGRADDLEHLLEDDASLAAAEYTLPHAFTPLEGVTLLHVCAEFNKVDCATALLGHGAAVDARAAIDANGLGGQTPIFHAVNSHDNFAYPMLEFLLDNGASVDISLKGILWGKSHEWETYIPEVNPISYAAIANLRQFQRREEDQAKNIVLMQNHKYGAAPNIPNVPNAYLQRSRRQRRERILRALKW